MYDAFLQQLSGIKKPPRGRSAVQHYQHERAAELSEVYKSEWADAIREGIFSPDTKQTGNWRGTVARKIYDALPKEDQEEWAAAAKEHNDERKDEY